MILVYLAIRTTVIMLHSLNFSHFDLVTNSEEKTTSSLVPETLSHIVVLYFFSPVVRLLNTDNDL